MPQGHVRWSENQSNEVTNLENVRISFRQYRYFLLPINRIPEYGSLEKQRYEKSKRETAFYSLISKLSSVSNPNDSIYFELFDKSNCCFLFIAKFNPIGLSPDLKAQIANMGPIYIFINPNPKEHLIWIQQNSGDENILMRDILFKTIYEYFKEHLTDTNFEFEMSAVLDDDSFFNEIDNEGEGATSVQFILFSSNMSNISEMLDSDISNILDSSNSQRGYLFFESSQHSSLEVRKIFVIFQPIINVISQGGGRINVVFKNKNKNIPSICFARKQNVNLKDSEISAKSLEEVLK